MPLRGSTKSKIKKDKNGENMPKVTELVLIHCKDVNNSYQQNSRVLYTFVPNKSFIHLLDISPEIYIYFKHFSFRIVIY